MTIIFSQASKQGTYAVLAAEQLVSGVSESGLRTRDLERKIHLHPSLPLAFSSGGMASWCESGDRIHARDLIARALEPITADTLNLSRMTACIGRSFQSFTRSFRNTTQSAPLGGLPRKAITVFLAWAANGKANLARLMITDRLSGEPIEHSIGFPAALQPYYADMSEFRADEHISDSLVLADHARKAVQGGIDYEAGLEVERKCGGPVDVTVINGNGETRSWFNQLRITHARDD